MRAPPTLHAKRNNANLRTVLVLFISYLSFSMFRLSLGMALPSIISEMKISEVQAGFLYSINLLSSAFLLTPSGLMADQIGRKRVLVLGYLLLAVGVLLFSVSPNYFVLAASLAVAGAGSSMIIPSYYSLMGELLKQVRGFAVGLGLTSYQIGGLIGSYLVGAFISLNKWRTPFIIMGILEVIVFFAQIFVIDVPPVKEERHMAFFSILKTRNILVSCVSVLFGSISYFTITAWLPSFLISRGVGLAETGLILGLFYISGAVSPPILGGISEKIGRKKATFYVGMAAALAAAATFLATQQLTSIICAILLGMLISPHRSLLVTIAQESVSEKSVSAATGLTQTIGLLGGAAGPIISGTLIPLLGLDYALFYSTVSSSILYGLFVLLIREAN